MIIIPILRNILNGTILLYFVLILHDEQFKLTTHRYLYEKCIYFIIRRRNNIFPLFYLFNEINIQGVVFFIKLQYIRPGPFITVDDLS